MDSSVAICRSHWRRPDIRRRASAGATSGRDRRGLCAGCRSGRLAGTAHRGRCGDQHRRDPAGGSRAAFRCHPRPGAQGALRRLRRGGRAPRDPGLGARCGCRCRDTVRLARARCPGAEAGCLGIPRSRGSGGLRHSGTREAWASLRHRACGIRPGDEPGCARRPSISKRLPCYALPCDLLRQGDRGRILSLDLRGSLHDVARRPVAPSPSASVQLRTSNNIDRMMRGAEARRVQPEGGFMDRSSKTGADAVLRPLVARLVWARRRRGPKHPIPRMPPAGNHRLRGTASLPRNRYPGEPVLNPRF